MFWSLLPLLLCPDFSICIHFLVDPPFGSSVSLWALITRVPPYRDLRLLRFRDLLDNPDHESSPLPIKRALTSQFTIAPRRDFEGLPTRQTDGSNTYYMKLAF